MRECPRQEVEGKRERDFSIVKREITIFLKNQLRGVQNFVAFDKQSREVRQQRIDYLEGIIDSLERGHLSLAREYFEKLIEEKERVAMKIASYLREIIAAAKPEVDRLNGESARLLKQLEIEKDRGDMKRIQVISKELGNIDDAIVRVGQNQEEIRQNLKRAQDDPDLNQFRIFIVAIDKEMGKGH